MSKLVFLFVCVAVFQLANALQCYHCDKEKCETDMKLWQKSNCAVPASPEQKPICIKHVYKDGTTHKDTISRKCALVNKKETYQCGNIIGELVSCDTCDTDLCNSAPKVTFSIVAVCAAVLAMVIPRFLV